MVKLFFIRNISDNLGSVRMVVDIQTGKTVPEISYDEFGNVLSDTNPGFQPFYFAGGIYEQDTRLIKFGARDYDPQTGRWTTKEPLGFAGSMNFYVYADGDSVNRIDLDGLDWLSFDGNSLTWWDENNNPIKDFDAKSGPFGKGALPKGMYLVDLNSYRKRDPSLKQEQGFLCNGEWGYSFNLEPQFKTSRTLLRIHPDGNNPGTKGCIGIQCKNGDAANLLADLLQYFFRGNKIIELYVTGVDKE